MTADRAPSHRRRMVRLWWAGPTAIVAASGVALVIATAPELASRVTVPANVVVRTSPHSSSSPAPSVRPTTPPSPPVAPPPTPHVVPPTPHVVPPVRPIVTVSSDDDKTPETSDR